MALQSRSDRTFLVLIALLALLAGGAVLFPQGGFLPIPTEEELPAPRWVLAIVNVVSTFLVYGGLGYLGLRLSRKLGWAGVNDDAVSLSRRFLWPFVYGVILGVLFILIDAGAANFHPHGRLPHPPFPSSLVASAAAGIGEEMLFRLFLVPVVVFLIGVKLFKGKHLASVFWGASFFSAVTFAVGHIPSALLLLGVEGPADIHPVLYAEMFLLNGSVAMLAAFLLRRDGFIAAVGLHFWVDVIFHVVWGAMSA